jgi:hypothetical protein
VLKEENKYKLKYTTQNNTQGLSYISHGGNNMALCMDARRKFYILLTSAKRVKSVYILPVDF